MLTKTHLLCGQPSSPAAPILLRAGPLRLSYDAASGFARRIMLGRREVLRGIYGAVRDQDWVTVPGAFCQTLRIVERDSFHIEFESEHRQGEAHFVWRGIMQGSTDGTLRYTFEGEARSTFRRNRIGLCVLHPIRECAGARARQKRQDGSVVECRFPSRIEPQIPGQAGFRDLRGLAHEVGDGVWAELDFEGDIFEMEDQRNWTDASFKTYCTPLALPFPVEIPKGAVVRQSVTLRLTGWAASHVAVSDEAGDAVTLTLPKEPVSRRPQVGLGIASHEQQLTDREVMALRELSPAHLRVDLRLAETNAAKLLDRAAAEALRLGAGVELALHLPREGQMVQAEAARALESHRGNFARVLALREGEPTTSPETLRTTRALLGRCGAPVGAGSDCNFCELNREQALGRMRLEEADFVFWSVNPQVHAFDHASVMETIEAQPDTVGTARAFDGDRPLVVSPVTLRRRFNAVASGPPRAVPPGQLPPEVDARQLSFFAAAWTLGSLEAWFRAGAESVTYYETTGWRGVMEREAGPPLPEEFPSQAGTVFPLFHVFAALASYERFAAVTGTEGSPVAALGLFGGSDERWLLLGNKTPQDQVVRLLEVPPVCHGRLLHSQAAEDLLYNPAAFHSGGGEPWRADGQVLTLKLPPYALARLSLGARLGGSATSYPDSRW